MTSPTDLPFGLGGTPDSGADSAAPQTTSTRVHDQVEALLAEYGLQFEVDDEGDYTFEVNEQRLYAKVNEEAEGYVRVFGQWRMVDGLPGGPLEWYDTATRVSMEVPLVKVLVVPDGLIVTCDTVAPEGGRLDVILRMCIENVLHGVNFWHDYLFEAAGQEAASGGRHRAPIVHPEEEQGNAEP